MITPAKILNKYKSVERYLDPVRKKVGDSLGVLCERNNGFALASRIKTLESVSEKIETGRFRNWCSIDDLVAATVIVPTLADEPKVVEYLDETFERVVCKRRGTTKKAPDVFRFDCTRYVGKLRSAGEEASTPMHEVLFEVQVKSAFEHAWSVTTHALAYKSDDISWRSLRLASQLKAAVEQLDTLILAFADASEYVAESEWPEIAAKCSLKEFYQSNVRDGRIPEELIPKDWTRFVDNVYRLVLSGPNRLKPTDAANVIRRDLGAELAELGVGAVPRSISLWQLTFASLYKAGTLTQDLREHWPLITPELESLYPKLLDFGPRFDYS